MDWRYLGSGPLGILLAPPPYRLRHCLQITLKDSTIYNSFFVHRALSRKHHESGGIDSITISTGNQEKKKKMKKKKQKPPKIHLVHPMMVPMKEMAMEEKGRGFGRTQSWVVGESPRLENATLRKGRNVMTDVWNMGEKALDAVAEHAMKKDEVEDGISDKSSVEGGWWLNGSVVCNVFYLFIRKM